MKKMMAVLVAVLALVAWANCAQAATCAVGDKAQVEWKGSWYSAKVLKAADDRCYIHYDGYGSNWNEWVGPDRIKITQAAGPGAASEPTATYSIGDPVQVKWKGTWYPASVLAVSKKGTYKIHYDGYASSWDEWVGPSRMKK